MAGQIKIEELVAELQKGSGYKSIDNDELGYYHYETVRFVFEKDNVTITKRYGYNGEEDMTLEWFDAEWQCMLPKKLADEVLSQLVKTGHATIIDANISETYSGRRAYGNPGKRIHNYKNNLELTLREGQKPIIQLENSQETPNASRL